MRTRLVSAALALVILVGCGTRVERAAGGTTFGELTDASGGVAASAPDVGAAGAGASGRSGQTAGSSAFGSQAAPGDGYAGSGSRPAVAPSKAIGVTATTIRIGFTYSATATFAQFKQICPQCASLGNQTYFPALVNALANDANKRGGIVGRKIVTEGHPWDSSAAASNSSQYAQIAQETCQHFAKDAPSLAVLGFFGIAPRIAPCLTKYGVSTIAPANGGQTVASGPLVRSTLYYAPGAPLDDLYEPVYAKRLVAQGYFGGWNTSTGAPGPAPLKIGMVSFTDADLPHRDQLLERALRANGYKLTDHLWYGASLDTQSRDIQNAILKFRSEGITHILGTAANALFAYETSGQQYYPRYSWDCCFSNDQNPQSEHGLRGNIGVGMFPVLDIDPSEKPPSVGARQARCEQIATKAGVDWQSNQHRRADSLAVCEGFWSVIDALSKSRTLTPIGLQRGYESLGSSVPSTLTFHATWGPNRHASADTVADIRYYESCTCFRYTAVRTKF